MYILDNVIIIADYYKKKLLFKNISNTVEIKNTFIRKNFIFSPKKSSGNRNSITLARPYRTCIKYGRENSTEPELNFKKNYFMSYK